MNIQEVEALQSQGLKFIKSQVSAYVDRMSLKYDNKVKLVLSNQYDKGETVLFVVSKVGQVMEEKSTLDLMLDIKKGIEDIVEQNKNMLMFARQYKKAKAALEVINPEEWSLQLFSLLMDEEKKRGVGSVKLIMSKKHIVKKSQIPGMQGRKMEVIHYQIVGYNPSPVVFDEGEIDALVTQVMGVIGQPKKSES